MVSRGLNRRDFAKLSMAALGGLAAGCSARDDQNDAPDAGEEVTVESEEVVVETASAEGHLCRGLNDCQGKGKSGDNECRGQGDCATYEAHSCHAMNMCKGQGGCGENPGENNCKGEGECAVPLMDSAWDKLRAKFEAEMKTKGLDYGEAPAKT